jgi:hypothetical protein
MKATTTPTKKWVRSLFMELINEFFLDLFALVALFLFTVLFFFAMFQMLQFG